MFRQRNPDYFAPKQFSKLVKGTGVFSCACVCVEFRLITPKVSTETNFKDNLCFLMVFVQFSPF